MTEPNAKADDKVGYHSFKDEQGTVRYQRRRATRATDWSVSGIFYQGRSKMLESRARLFATAAHGAVGQKRKYTGEAYIYHPANVVEIVRSVPHTEDMLAAAWLHDVVEDTKVDFDTIEVEFGVEVVWLVRWLTDTSKPEDGNRVARKAIDLARLAQAPAAAQTIKVADLIDNAKSIVEHDPSFARVFLAEKAALLKVLTLANPALLARAHATVAAGFNALGIGGRWVRDEPLDIAG